MTRQERLRAIWRRYRPVVFVLIVLLASLNVYLCRVEDRRTSSRNAIASYLQHSYPPLHRQTQSLQAAMAGLIDDTASDNPAFAMEVLDDEIIPAAQRLLDTAGTIAPGDEAARDLHREYYHLIESLLVDAREARAVFAGAGTIMDKRKAVNARLLALRDRFGAFYTRVRTASAEVGLHVI
jgi:hypothetical protein